MKKLLTKLMILCLAIGCVRVQQTAAALSELEHGIIRLHITADSDSLADQTQKLIVRDAILQHPFSWESAEDCCAVLEQQLPEIERISKEALAKAGSDASVRAELTEEDFPARQYGEITLPAGTYRALRVTLGSGSGQNWWCVMYPGMCLPAASAQTVLSSHFAAETCALTASPEHYEIRLKCVDLIRSVWRKVQALFANS
ncbi:MAG: stage II sporulation protein R [Oscillospiraceae bacterium]|nr:stage II sporulation protein R [Oscillospiraceae bacterium]